MTRTTEPKARCSLRSGADTGLCAPASCTSLPCEAVAGVDEAGRGCLAGPVVAAAVILPPRYDLPGLTDSKALSAKARAMLAPRIKACAVAWAVGLVWPRRIEEINILQATLEAMSRAVARLSTAPQGLLIDGNKTLPAGVLTVFWKPPRPLPLQEAIVGGDASCPAISAASVLAKTCRDALMTALARRWPHYGFEQHKGYGTRAHYAALRAHGPCPLHRLTFRGVLPQSQASESDAGPQQGFLCCHGLEKN